MTKGEITSAIQKPARESAGPEKWAESSLVEAVMELEWARIKLGDVWSMGKHRPWGMSVEPSYEKLIRHHQLGWSKADTPQFAPR